MLSNSNRKERKILLQILLQYKAIIVEHHSSPAKLTKGKDIIYMTNVSFFFDFEYSSSFSKDGFNTS